MMCVRVREYLYVKFYMYIYTILYRRGIHILKGLRIANLCCLRDDDFFLK